MDPEEPRRRAGVREVKRLAASLAAWTALALASPGVALADGSAVLAILGIGLWGWSAALPIRSRRGALLAEALAGALGGVVIFGWIGYVVAPGLLWVAAGTGFYNWLGCWLVRRLARRLPLALAVACGWLGSEGLRTHVPAPFGLSWVAAGHHLHALLPLAGSARVWGVEGLSLVVAAAGGGLSQLLARRRPALAAAVGLAPLGTALLLARAVPAPASEDGPRVLFVQPGFPQERKRWDDPMERFRDLRDLTLEAELAARRRGEAPFDLVAWGETMLPVPLFEPGMAEALRAGLEIAPWSPLAPEEGASADLLVAESERSEEDLVRSALLGLGRLPRDRRFLAPGTSFLSGAEVFGARDGRLVRWNAVVLYDPQGQRSAPAAKRYLVPGAESGMGLERFAAARAFARWIGGYVPDFTAGEETGVLELALRDGRRLRVGATVCFDNAYLAPYVEPLRRGELDFHLVVSNEAWYRESWELDQMVAFSRLIALSTGRAMARATNSGVTLVLGPDGRELARLTVDGRDRSVPGTLGVVVPVPVRAAAGPATPYVRTRTAWILLTLVLPWLLALLPARRGPCRNPPAPAG